MNVAPQKAKQHPLKRLALDLQAAHDSLEYTDGLNDFWRDYRAETGYRLKLCRDVLKSLEQENIR